MRLVTAFLLSIAVLVFSPAIPAGAADDAPPVKGLFLITDYPAVTVRPGTTSTVSLRLQNYALPPERLAVAVSGVPAGWTATILGGGQPVAAVMAASNQSTSLQLRLEVPASAPMGTQNLTVTAKGATEVTLPIAVTLAKELPAKLTLEAQLPSLRGTAKSSFEYQLNVKNDSGRNLVVALGAQAPQNFETSFTEQYGSQELSSIPVEAGQSKTVKLKVRPPGTIGASRYPVSVKASAEDATADTTIALEITGQPRLTLAGRDGVLSGRAEAGKEASIPIVVTNSGTAAADEIELSGSAPSGWKIVFEPKTIDRLAPGANKEVQALVTPPEKAIAGDYAPSFNVASRGDNANVQFRVAVTTSTLWGIVGAGIIAIALLIMVGAVARFGRR